MNQETRDELFDRQTQLQETLGDKVPPATHVFLNALAAVLLAYISPSDRAQLFERLVREVQYDAVAISDGEGLAALHAKVLQAHMDVMEIT